MSVFIVQIKKLRHRLSNLPTDLQLIVRGQGLATRSGSSVPFLNDMPSWPVEDSSDTC